MANEPTTEDLQKKITELEGSNKELSKQVEDLKEDNQALEDTIGELQNELEQLSQAPAASSSPEITHKKKKYRVLIPRFRFDQKDYGLQDLQENEALVAQILKKEGQGILKPLKS